MLSSALGAAPGISASIPSPSISSFSVFGIWTVHFYALCIIAGIIVAVLMTNSRLTKRGAEKWVVIDIALWAVPIAIIGARIFHVLTHFDFYFGEGKNPLSALYIWEGGIAIYGALIGGAVGAWIGCRWTGIRFWTFADALAPGIILAQAIGRFGNWFNKELFGQPTDLPWGLEIPSDNPAVPAGLAEGTLFHPTFLYEVIWNTLGALFLLWVGKRFALQWGKLFGLYLIWYSAGRIVWESIRIDPSDIILGLRTNVWSAILGVVIGLVIIIVQSRRHLGAEPSPYVAGRGPADADAAQNDEDSFVDVSDPQTPAVKASAATSSTADAISSGS